MNESTSITRDSNKRNKRLSQLPQQQQPQQPPPRDARRRVAAADTIKTNRPRSGSWGAQELHYYKNNATTTPPPPTITTTVDPSLSDQNNNTLMNKGTRPKSRFLSKLKMQRSTTTTPTTMTDPLSMSTSTTTSTLPGSSSVMTLASSTTTATTNHVNGYPPVVPPSSESFMMTGSNYNNNNNNTQQQQKRRPPLPLELVHPEHQTTGVRSTPHPSLARYEEKPLPRVINNIDPSTSLFTMTPAQQQQQQPVPVPSPSKNNLSRHNNNNLNSNNTINNSNNHNNSNNKKRTTAIRSIGRFFRALGKNQPSSSLDSSNHNNTMRMEENNTIIDNPSLDQQQQQPFSPIMNPHSRPTTLYMTQPHQQSSSVVVIKRSKSIDTIIPALSEEPADDTTIQEHHRPLSRKYSTLNCIETKPHQRPSLRRSLSLDDIQCRHDQEINRATTNDTTPSTATTTPPSEEMHTIQRKKPLASSSPTHSYRCRRRGRRRRQNSSIHSHQRTSTATTTDEEDDDDDYRNNSEYNMILSSDAEDDFIDPRAAQESQIAGDRLSKRLSGGHFGSAGGLILSTLPVASRPQTDDEYEMEVTEEDAGEDKNNIIAPESMSSTDMMTVPTTSTTMNDESELLRHQLEQQHHGGASTVHTETTSESDTIVTPPNLDHSYYPSVVVVDPHTLTKSQQDEKRRDSIAPVDPYEKAEIHRVNEETNDQEEFNQLAIDTAKRIWEQDPTVYANIEHIAEWIGNGKLLSMRILQHYFMYFDFTNMRLDDAFRKLCGRLHLKAESQQIDRILVEFANRYWDCNPTCIFGNSDVVHAVVYSVLLLNTDLHVAQGDHKKMSRSAFVRNTMNAARAQYERNTVSMQLSAEEEENTPLREDHRNSNITFQSFDSRSQSYDLKRTNSCKSSTSSNTGTNGSSLGRFYSTAASSLDMTPAAVVHGNHPMGSKGWQSEVEAILREMYVSIRNRQIRHPASKDDSGQEETNTRHSRRRSLQITGSRVGAFKRSVGTIMWKAARESMVVSEHAELDRFYGTATNTTNDGTPASPRSTTSVHSNSFPRRRSMTSLKSSFSQSSHLTQQSNSITAYQSVAPLLHHSELPTSYTSAAPYYKEGLLVRKHLLERAGQKAKHRDWKECFLVVDRGEIRMYRLDGGPSDQRSKSMARSSIMISRVNLAEALANNPTTAVGGGDWLANAETIGEIDLKHTLSNALPSGYSRQRPHAFALQQPNGGVFLFQVGSAEQVVEWVSTCNYWAARESKEPLMGGVSNMEYGWGGCLDCISLEDDEQVDTVVSWQNNAFPPVTIHEWQPPVPPSVGSAMEEAAQLDTLHKHVSKLNDELDKHRDIKRRMELRFSTRSTAGARAMNNWENKSQYLLHEIIKYQNYCDAIEKSLALQAKAVEEEQKKKKESITEVVEEEEEDQEIVLK